MKITISIFIVTLIFPFYGSAQNLMASGKVMTKNTGSAIPFATVSYSSNYKSYTHYTDSAGTYRLGIPKDVDSVIISCVGYKSATIASYDFTRTNIVMLSDLTYALNEITVTSNLKKRKRFRLGSFKENTKTIGYGSIGISDYISGNKSKYHNYVAVYINNPKGDSTSLISKLLYNLTNKPKHLELVLKKLDLVNYPCSETRLRIHLFDLDPKTGMPNNDLLRNNIIIKNNCNSIGDLIIDISDQNILMPANGVFVALEYIDLLPMQKKVYYPFYITKFNSKNANTYESYQQKNWLKMDIGSRDTQFGIELVK